MVQKNEIFTLDVTEMTNLGAGVSRTPDGEVVFIPGAVDGDTVTARIIFTARGYAVARVEHIITPSPYRVQNLCRSVGCGGCGFRDTAFAHECEVKRKFVAHCLKEAYPGEIEVRPTVVGTRVDGYRNKAQYPVGKKNDGTVYFGFFAPRSHRVVEAAHCPLQPAVFGEILDTLAAFFTETHVSVYDETTHIGLLRHLYLRRSEQGDVLLTVVICGERLPDEAAFVRTVRAAHPCVIGISINIQMAATNVICGERYRSLYGEDALTDILAGVRLRISPESFYQVNHEAAELLYAGAREAAALSGDEVLLDLYCGVGSIGLSMAHFVRQVIGIEIVPGAIRCAKENAIANGIDNALFFAGDAGGTESLLTQAETALGSPIHPDIVVLDPPRKGCDEKLLSFLATLAPDKILYISCNPQTLARDMAYLAGVGYCAQTVTPYNLFPRTAHVETVVLMSKVR